MTDSNNIDSFRDQNVVRLGADSLPGIIVESVAFEEFALKIDLQINEWIFKNRRYLRPNSKYSTIKR